VRKIYQHVKETENTFREGFVTYSLSRDLAIFFPLIWLKKYRPHKLSFSPISSKKSYSPIKNDFLQKFSPSIKYDFLQKKIYSYFIFNINIIF